MSASHNQSPFVAKFVPLDCPYVNFEQDRSVAVITSSLYGDSERRFVYLDRPLITGVEFIITTCPTVDLKKIVKGIGLTTCGPSKLIEYSYHVDQICNGNAVCGGYSSIETTFSLASSLLFANDSRCSEIIIKKLEEDHFGRVTMKCFDNCRISQFLRDNSEGEKMSGQTLYPFLELSLENTNEFIRVTTQKDWTFDLLTQTKSLNRVQDLKDAKSWYVSRGIGVANGSLCRKSLGPHYAVCCETLAPGQVYTFLITGINDSVNEETFTLGFTTADIESVQLDSLPPPIHQKKKSWRVFNNVVPSVKRGDTIKIHVLPTGLWMRSRREHPHYIAGNLPQNSHLFIYLTAKIESVSLSLSGSDGKRDEKRFEGICIVCLVDKSNHLMDPCAHVCLCDTCAVNFDRSSGCPVCRANITIIKKIFIA